MWVWVLVSQVLETKSKVRDREQGSRGGEVCSSLGGYTAIGCSIQGVGVRWCGLSIVYMIHNTVGGADP